MNLLKTGIPGMCLCGKKVEDWQCQTQIKTFKKMFKLCYQIKYTLHSTVSSIKLEIRTRLQVLRGLHASVNSKRIPNENLTLHFDRIPFKCRQFAIIILRHCCNQVIWLCWDLVSFLYICNLALLQIVSHR